MTTDNLDHQVAGISRRTALKRGALVGGAVVWAVPTVQAIAMSAAHATLPSGGGGGGGGGGQVVGKIPSHAVFLVRSGTTTYGFKADVSTSPSNYLDKIPGPDASFLATKGYSLGSDYISDPTDKGWLAALAAMQGHAAPGKDANNEQAIVLTLPVGFTFVIGWAFDGGLQKAPATALHDGGSKYQQYVAAKDAHGNVVAYLFYGAGH